MTNEISPTDAILNVLRSINLPIDQPIVLFEVGIPLIVEQRYTQDEVLNGLYWLQSEGVIQLMDGNRMKLVKPLPEASDTCIPA